MGGVEKGVCANHEIKWVVFKRVCPHHEIKWVGLKSEFFHIMNFSWVGLDETYQRVIDRMTTCLLFLFSFYSALLSL